LTGSTPTRDSPGVDAIRTLRATVGQRALARVTPA